MPTQEVDYPQFWRFRAEEVRRIADDMKVVEAKAIMTRIAEDYERIADLVEQRLRERVADIVEQWLRDTQAAIVTGAKQPI
jgi:hypothetical protein